MVHLNRSILTELTVAMQMLHKGFMYEFDSECESDVGGHQ